MRVVTIVTVCLMLIACGDDGGDTEKSGAEVICRKAQTCPQLEAFTSYDYCVEKMDPMIAQYPRSCENCLKELSCAGLKEGLDGNPAICPSCN